MGVYIFMDILPSKINKEEWENVYEESIDLIKAYPFMDYTFDRETYGVMWRYAHRTGYTDLQQKWHIVGDYDTMLTGESFSLSRDIEVYRKKDNVKNGSDDIIAEEINRNVFYDQEELQIPVGSVNVFDGKTQREPFHNYLLAIACLFESRFPKHVIVRGIYQSVK
ncbi:hypothetical protein KFZ58_14545 [Virgibacillus sp. NKC19-16]|uniref:hypothetical protein n=1 Tax=Virgibacillus salidurans TaxID=2831673 RepID=UPI001F20B49D|nr:hypothetical protein [Virgibacillus sp. NKC19-16]UJL45605.1 hypothetical protein KFZ58_14545 [Virgibacillus sp. NKC19-16]